MQKSDSIGNLSKALTAVQAALKPAIKDSNNPFFKSKYADLNSVWDSCRELLAANGLSVIQGNSVGLDNTVIVETILAHESGEWIQSELSLPLAKHDPQGVGSAVTYGRRYGLAAGACEFGVKQWMDSVFNAKEKAKILKSGIKASDLFPILKQHNAYGFEKFQSLFAEAV